MRTYGCLQKQTACVSGESETSVEMGLSQSGKNLGDFIIWREFSFIVLISPLGLLVHLLHNNQGIVIYNEIVQK